MSANNDAHYAMTQSYLFSSGRNLSKNPGTCFSHELIICCWQRCHDLHERKDPWCRGISKEYDKALLPNLPPRPSQLSQLTAKMSYPYPPVLQDWASKLNISRPGRCRQTMIAFIFISLKSLEESWNTNQPQIHAWKHCHLTLTLST